LRFSLPLPPSVNALYGNRTGQQRFKSKKYKAWLAECELPLRGGGVTPQGGVVELTYTYYFPDKRSRDCENYVKAVSDFLVAQQIIQDDDCFHVPKLTIIFGGIDKNSRVEIEIEKASN
jgi:Holliday junction resolvase RusA-like endonuclease